jgi:hypothetical protein
MPALGKNAFVCLKQQLHCLKPSINCGENCSNLKSTGGNE